MARTSAPADVPRVSSSVTGSAAFTRSTALHSCCGAATVAPLSVRQRPAESGESTNRQGNSTAVSSGDGSAGAGIPASGSVPRGFAVGGRTGSQSSQLRTPAAVSGTVVSGGTLNTRRVGPDSTVRMGGASTAPTNVASLIACGGKCTTTKASFAASMSSSTVPSTEGRRLTISNSRDSRSCGRTMLSVKLVIAFPPP